MISKAERYKPYPIAGAGLMTGGMLLLSGLDQGSSDVLAALYMLIIGIGIGLVMQVVILVAQNHAPREHIGVATSTATFARAIGASIGVAIFGAIFATRLSSELSALGPAGERISAAGARLDPAAGARPAGHDQARGDRRLRQRAPADLHGRSGVRGGGDRGTDAAAPRAARGGPLDRAQRLGRR